MNNIEDYFEFSWQSTMRFFDLHFSMDDNNSANNQKEIYAMCSEFKLLAAVNSYIQDKRLAFKQTNRLDLGQLQVKIIRFLFVNDVDNLNLNDEDIIRLLKLQVLN